MISRSNRSRRGRKHVESDPLDKDYGFGYSDEGRPITGVTDGNVHDPQAEILDEKGETTYHDMTRVKSIRMCRPDQHVMVADDSEPDFNAETCQNCPYGRLISHK